MTQSAQSAVKAEELWEKYKQPGNFDGFTGDIVCKLDFLAALSEYAKIYGEMVRKEDAEVCRAMMYPDTKPPFRIAPGEPYFKACAAAISNKELPELP